MRALAFFWGNLYKIRIEIKRKLVRWAKHRYSVKYVSGVDDAIVDTNWVRVCVAKKEVNYVASCGYFSF